MNVKYVFVYVAVFVLYFIISSKILNYFFAPTMFFNLVISVFTIIILMLATKITVDKIFE